MEFALDFRKQVEGMDSVHAKLKTKKLDLWVRPWSLTPSYNLNLEPLGWCNSEPLKKLKSSRSQVIFEIGSINNFAIFTGKHLFWGLFLIKFQGFRPATFLKRDSNTGVSCGYYELFKNSFFTENLRWLLLTVQPQYSEDRLSVSYLISRLHVLSNLIKSLRKTLHK